MSILLTWTSAHDLKKNACGNVEFTRDGVQFEMTVYLIKRALIAVDPKFEQKIYPTRKVK